MRMSYYCASDGEHLIRIIDGNYIKLLSIGNYGMFMWYLHGHLKSMIEKYELENDILKIIGTDEVFW